MSLLKWQHQFKECILSNNDITPFSDNFSSDPARLNIYKNNVFHSLTEALSSQFPTVKKLVGEKFFNACCNKFIKSININQTAMIFIGEEFSDFLKNFEHTKHMIFLSEMANFEFKKQQVYLAKEEESINIEKVQKYNLESLQSSQVTFLKAMSIINSPLAVYDIWRNNQQNINEKINIDKSQNIVIFRKEHQIQFLEITPAQNFCISLWKSGHSIAEGLQNTLNKNGEFNPTEMIQIAFINGFFTQIKEK